MILFRKTGELKGFCDLHLWGLLGYIQSIAAQSAETGGYGLSGIHVFSLDPAHQYNVAAKQISWPSWIHLSLSFLDGSEKPASQNLGDLVA